jgi:hypothetical protein
MSVLGSAEGAIPGTIVLGEKAACSTSAKWLAGCSISIKPSQGFLIGGGAASQTDSPAQVTYIPVQRQFAQIPQWVVRMRPHFGGVENIDMVVLSLPGGHDLHAERPRWKVAPLDRVPHIRRVVVGVFAGELFGLGDRHRLHALVGSQVELDIDERVILSR